MSCFSDDRATMSEQAVKLEEQLTRCGMNEVLQKAFEAGMNLDEIMYVLFSHTEKTVRRYIVQDQLKRVANKDK